MINYFAGEYRWLSNFWEAPVTYNGLTYRSSEAAFQAQKTMDEHIRNEFTKISPASAKGEGRNLKLRPDWEKVKYQVMYDICRAKFTQNEDLRQKLLDTGDEELVEGNTWNDTYWGVDLVYGKGGQNNLGKILMQIRSELRDKI